MRPSRVSMLAFFVWVSAAACAVDSAAPQAATSPTDSSQAVPSSPSPSASADEDRIRAAPRQRIKQTDEFGLVASARPSSDAGLTIEVDRVDMLGGAEAEAAAAARGDDVSNDYYLVNDNPRLRSYTVAPTAVVWGSIMLTRTVDASQVTFEKWAAFVRTKDAASTLFHFDVENGLVVAVEEQYRP